MALERGRQELEAPYEEEDTCVSSEEEGTFRVGGARSARSTQP
jgi:hypothetical protein